MSAILKTLALGGIAAFAYKHWKKDQNNTVAATSPYVRDAGPEQQLGIRNDDWDKLDEQVDESFPASDPPANY